jgi:cytochrome c-type biogenesis protein CcmH
MKRQLRSTWQILTYMLIAVASPAAWAVMPDEVLADPALEARARALSQDLRCLVCQNQSIDDSAAPLARDLRVLVRERLAAGDSDDQVIAYLSQRYGSYVLLKPPLNAETLPLWIGPGVILVLAGGVFAAYMRRRGNQVEPVTPQLTDDERRQLTVLNSESST